MTPPTSLLASSASKGRPTGLSPRESTIVGLVGRGLTNREIAEGLDLSSNTVKTHLRRIYAKLTVTDRAGVIEWAAGHGLDAPTG